MLNVSLMRDAAKAPLFEISKLLCVAWGGLAIFSCNDFGQSLREAFDPSYDACNDYVIRDYREAGALRPLGLEACQKGFYAARDMQTRPFRANSLAVCEGCFASRNNSECRALGFSQTIEQLATLAHRRAERAVRLERESRRLSPESNAVLSSQESAMVEANEAAAMSLVLTALDQACRFGVESFLNSHPIDQPGQ